MKTRWVVRYETTSLTGWVLNCAATVVSGYLPTVSPHVTYSYYRWRWLARLDVAMRSGFCGGTVTYSQLLGRIHVKPAAERATETLNRSWRLQREIYEIACRAYWSPQ